MKVLFTMFDWINIKSSSFTFNLWTMVLLYGSDSFKTFILLFLWFQVHSIYLSSILNFPTLHVSGKLCIQGLMRSSHFMEHFTAVKRWLTFISKKQISTNKLSFIWSSSGYVCVWVFGCLWFYFVIMPQFDDKFGLFCSSLGSVVVSWSGSRPRWWSGWHVCHMLGPMNYKILWLSQGAVH